MKTIEPLILAALFLASLAGAFVGQVLAWIAVRVL